MPTEYDDIFSDIANTSAESKEEDKDFFDSLFGDIAKTKTRPTGKPSFFEKVGTAGRGIGVSVKHGYGDLVKAAKAMTEREIPEHAELLEKSPKYRSYL